LKELEALVQQVVEADRLDPAPVLVVAALDARDRVLEVLGELAAARRERHLVPRKAAIGRVTARAAPRRRRSGRAGGPLERRRHARGVDGGLHAAPS
jgi:hypothetical protein